MAVKIIRTAPKPKKLASGESELAVVYARYSSHAQGEQSIDGQLAAARAFASAKGYTIIHEYIDRAKTGKNDNREEFQQMLSDTASHQFTVIIVWKIDRFGRNRAEMAVNKQICYANGVRIEYVAETLSDGPESVLLESLLEGMAEYYSLQLAQNVRRGMLENAKKGLSVGGTVPLGYKLNRETKKYELDPKTAPIVREIFEQYANGKMMMQIVSWLNERGIATPRGKAFTKSSLVKLLRNEKYIGIYKYQDVRIENGVPAIIDEKTFRKVQDMLVTNRTRKSSDVWNVRDYLLSDRCFCGRCGAPMVGMSGAGKSGNKYSYYACTAHLRKKTCNKRSIRQDILEPLVLQMTKSLLQDEELMNAIADQVYTCLNGQDEAAEKLTALKAQLADVDKSIAGLTKAIESGLFNDAIKARMEELDGQHQALRTAIADLELRNIGKSITREQIDFFLHRFRDADLNLPECQKRFIKTFVNAVYVFDDRVSVAFNFSDDEQETITLSDLIDGESAFVQSVPSSTILEKSELNSSWEWVRISSFMSSLAIQQNKGALQSRPKDFIPQTPFFALRRLLFLTQYSIASPLFIRCFNQVADIRPFARQHLVIKILFPIDISDAILQFLDRISQFGLLLGQHFLSRKNGRFACKAQFEVLLHLLNTQPAFFQAGKVFDPLDILLIKYAAIVFVSLDIGNKSFIAIKLQGLIGHIELSADLHHRIHVCFLHCC